jgi:hypothetical protein
MFPVITHAGGASGVWQYTPELGEAIARMYGDSEPGGLWGLHAAQPDYIPPPDVVTAWKRQHPAFGLLMREAEKLRAECMLEQSVVIADSDTGLAARVALKISARQHFAARLDPARFGNTPNTSPALGRPASDQPVALGVSDDALAAIALSGASVGK